MHGRTGNWKSEVVKNVICYSQNLIMLLIEIMVVHEVHDCSGTGWDLIVFVWKNKWQISGYIYVGWIGLSLYFGRQNIDCPYILLQCLLASKRFEVGILILKHRSKSQTPRWQNFKASIVEMAASKDLGRWLVRHIVIDFELYDFVINVNSI